VLTLTVVCDRAGCLAVDAVAIPTEDHLAHAVSARGLPQAYPRTMNQRPSSSKAAGGRPARPIAARRM
jgi:hypothetical protein